MEKMAVVIASSGVSTEILNSPWCFVRIQLYMDVSVSGIYYCSKVKKNGLFVKE
jgi:hypothetical protein